MQMLKLVMEAHTDLPEEDRDWLLALTREWHLFADTSFSDLVLWVVDRDDNVFWAAAQVRPNTGQTALEEDLPGEQVAYDPAHLVTEAYLSQEICETSDNQMQSGIPVDVWAIPILRSGRVIGIVERHTNQLGVRAPGLLEDCYLDIASRLADMLWHGQFPLDPPSQPSRSPKVGDGLLRLDSAGIVTYASPNSMSAFRKMGLSGDLEGEELHEIATSLAEFNVVAKSSKPDDFGRYALEVELDRPEAQTRLRILPLCYDGEESGSMVLCMDTTAIRNRERELVTKDATIREIHHRVKNNLQTVAALLRLQSRRVHSEEARDSLQEAMARVQSIAVVHEILSQEHEEIVNFDEVCDRILRMVGDLAAYGTVETKRIGSFGLVPAEVATSLSLVITELCQNAIEHGLLSQSGRVEVRPRREPGELVVDVVDQGTGLPQDFSMENTGGSLGMSIVTTLVSDLGGIFTLKNAGEDQPGAIAQVRIPLNQ